MTEAKIQNALYWEVRPAARFVVPNYVPGHWWECDLFHVTKAGYGVEHEIKLTKSDFLADFDKRKRYCYTTYDEVNKHDLLSGRATCEQMKTQPNQFWFVLPVDLIEQVDVPAYAGVKEVWRDGASVSVRTVKPAPRLGRAKVSDEVTKHARGVFYWRFWRQRIG